MGITNRFENIKKILIFTLITVSHLGLTSAKAEQFTIVAFGDSLTAGYQLAAKDSFPSQLEKKLNLKGYNVKVVNSGVSGDTTASGLARLNWAIPQKTDAIIIELGANDALRGIPTKETRSNLEKIVKTMVERNIPILIAGMLGPKSYGEKYVTEFETTYKDLSKQYNALLYPFFLKGVAGKNELNLSDGIHPNAKGISIIVDNILPSVEKLIDRIKAKK